MLASKSTTSEIQRLQQQLKEAQARLEVTICETQRYGNCVPEAEHILQVKLFDGLFSNQSTF
jgi:hypothetical protein